MSDNNAHERMDVKPVGVITLTFTAAPWHLDIKATVETFDQALAMLDQARRWFENQLRLAGVVEAQQQLERARQDAAIAAAVRGGRS